LGVAALVDQATQQALEVAAAKAGLVVVAAALVKMRLEYQNLVAVAVMAQCLSGLGKFKNIHNRSNQCRRISIPLNTANSSAL
jgi:hypothetical protein